MTYDVYHDAELMRIQAETLYVLDESRRIIGINEPSLAADTAVFVGMTRYGPQVHVAADMPGHIEQELRLHCEGEPDIKQLCTIVEGYQPVKRVWVGPAYAFPAEHAEPPAEPDVVVIRPSNADLLDAFFPEIKVELMNRQPVLGFVIGNAAVSVCCSARSSRFAAEAGLATAPAYRGRELAVKTAARWGWEVRRQGRIPLYSTSWSNLGSQRVAHKLRLYPYGMDFHITVQRAAI